ncbi:hypothetical protein G6F57_021677 [Rhizopus arrhizus]|nr:hypothetical protein G6F68_019161 [Rhizopus microsporus]KAG1434229.1 hypothetical protein G6F57_021677 [Rhizopus arrhizus]
MQVLEYLVGQGIVVGQAGVVGQADPDIRRLGIAQHFLRGDWRQQMDIRIGLSGRGDLIAQRAAAHAHQVRAGGHLRKHAEQPFDAPAGDEATLVDE